MSGSKTCGRCGAELSEDTAGGLCPRCLMALNFDSRTMPEGEEPPRVPPLSPEAMRERFPQFEILECLGRGGMGVVYKGRQKALDREVAIKVLAGEWQDDPAFAARFEREAKTLAQMGHPNIVTVHDFGEAGGLYYLVMEYVDGVNLRDLMREGKMAPEQALAIVPPVCEALEYAHGKGVVHRDIKPENVLLDRDGRVKIADFGIASLVGASGEKSGTPPYMAPEQERGSVDRRADIYALGVVLYEMLTGERPAKDLVVPSRKVQVDVKIDEMVLRALEKEPERRYQTAGEFRTVVETMARPADVTEGSVGKAFLTQAELDAFSEDPANWRYRFFYRCREDPRIVVPKRTAGFGWTVNLSNRWALPFVVALVAVLLGALRVSQWAGLTGAGPQGAVALALLLGVIAVCHRMSRGPVRAGQPWVGVRTMITAALALGLGALFWHPEGEAREGGQGHPAPSPGRADTPAAPMHPAEPVDAGNRSAEEESSSGPVSGSGQAGNVSVIVSGSVTRPGTYLLKEGSTVLDALAMAAGWTGGAEQWLVIRERDANRLIETEYDLNAILEGREQVPGISSGMSLSIEPEND